MWSEGLTKPKHWFIYNILQALRIAECVPSYNHIIHLGSLRITLFRLSKEHLHVVHGIVRFASRSGAHGMKQFDGFVVVCLVFSAYPALLYESFLFLSDLPLDTLNFVQTSSRLSPVHIIRHLLTSRDPNEQYLFLSCLECLDPVLWAGTAPETPAILEGWEVERVMQFLDSPDRLIRKKVGLCIAGIVRHRIMPECATTDVENFMPH